MDGNNERISQTSKSSKNIFSRASSKLKKHTLSSARFYTPDGGQYQPDSQETDRGSIKGSVFSMIVKN